MSDAPNVDHLDNSKRTILDKYVVSVHNLRMLVKSKYAIDAVEFDAYLFHHIFAKYNTTKHDGEHGSRCAPLSPSKGHLRSYGEFVAHSVWLHRRQYCAVMMAITICILLVNYKLEATNFFMRNIQTMIYPGMRAWRLATLPLIQTFPSLTQLYDETCLLGNPWFQVIDLPCQPCERVHGVLDMTGAMHLGQYFDTSAPYFVKVHMNFYEYSISI